MNTLTFEELIVNVEQLTLDEQLVLLERLARSVRERAGHRDLSFDAELETMAADPQIQHEIAIINRDFAIAESDGL